MTDPKTFDWKKYITECLESTSFCCIGTVDDKGVWTNPVYFAWDENCNIYFISQMHSRHMQNIQKNPAIAVSIFSTQQKEHAIGIQLEGQATILSGDDTREIKHAYDTYYGRAGTGPDVEGYINNPTWLYVKITPSHLYYFDTRFFEEERQTIPMEILKN